MTENLTSESQPNYQASRKSMYLILARMHDLGMTWA